MKTSELTGPALDYMVHVALGHSMHSCAYWLEKYADEQRRDMCEAYSTNWSHGGPIIEREGIPIRKHSGGTWYAHMNLGDGERAQWHKHEWVTSKVQKQVRFDGPTPLVAAMRCYVASKLGDEVAVPEELR